MMILRGIYIFGVIIQLYCRRENQRWGNRDRGTRGLNPHHTWGSTKLRHLVVERRTTSSIRNLTHQSTVVFDFGCPMAPYFAIYRVRDPRLQPVLEDTCTLPTHHLCYI